MQGARPQSGEYYEVILAASQTITKDEALTTNASGHLVTQGAAANVLFFADEDVTTAGSTNLFGGAMYCMVIELLILKQLFTLWEN